MARARDAFQVFPQDPGFPSFADAHELKAHHNGTLPHVTPEHVLALMGGVATRQQLVDGGFGTGRSWKGWPEVPRHAPVEASTRFRSLTACRWHGSRGGVSPPASPQPGESDCLSRLMMTDCTWR